MGGIEGLNKEQYEIPKPEMRLDEQVNTPNYKTINNFTFNKNAEYFHVMKREQKTNEPGFQESLQGIVELKKVDGNVIASFLKFGATKGKQQNKQEGRSIDPKGIPDSLRTIVEQKSKEIDTIPGNPEQSSVIDVFSDEENGLGAIRNDLGMLEKEVRADIMVS